MKYNAVKGNNKGISTPAIKDVGSLPPPEVIFIVTLTEEKHLAIDEVHSPECIAGSTYIVKIGPKKLSFKSGPVAELHVPTPALIDLLDDLGMDIHFVIFAVSAYKKLKGYCSLNDLEKFSRHINSLQLTWLSENDFASNEEWLIRKELLTEIARTIIQPHGLL